MPLKFGELASYNHGQETIAEWQREHETRQIMRFTGVLDQNQNPLISPSMQRKQVKGVGGDA